LSPEGGRVARAAACRPAAAARAHRRVARVSAEATVGRRPVARGWRPELQTLLYSIVLLTLGFLVLYPLALLLINSFQLSRPGQEAAYGLDAWRAAVSQSGMRSALLNTLTLTTAQGTLSTVDAVFAAWALARTDVYRRTWL